MFTFTSGTRCIAVLLYHLFKEPEQRDQTITSRWMEKLHPPRRIIDRPSAKCIRLFLYRSLSDPRYTLIFSLSVWPFWQPWLLLNHFCEWKTACSDLNWVQSLGTLFITIGSSWKKSGLSLKICCIMLTVPHPVSKNISILLRNGCL